jgi:hydrogenase 3 maturation protease
MCGLSWKASLRTALPRPTATNRRVALLGIGNEFSGDDAAGVTVARALGARLEATPRALVIDGGLAPESFTGPLRRFAPALVILVDAALMGADPGAVRWLDWQATAGLGGSTHTLPVHLLARFLVEDIGCAVALIGIQPAGNALGAPLSTAVEAAVMDVIETLAEALQ